MAMRDGKARHTRGASLGGDELPGRGQRGLLNILLEGRKIERRELTCDDGDDSLHTVARSACTPAAGA